MTTRDLRSGSGRDSRPSQLDTGRSNRGDRGQDELPVSQVGRYLLLKKLGEGGMGVVYAAYDPDLDRKVALKLLHSDGRTDVELARARLQREAQAMARISHPNVIPIFDVGVWGSQVFLAMELVDGGTLGSWMKEKTRPWREVLEKFLDAGRGLQAAHAVGLVHRDFKPANVLMSREGRVFVTDFGLARQVGESGREADFLPEEAQELVPSDNRMLETALTQSGLVMGTPNYMSPEQFRGADLDARSDQFSFCVALYFALYGKRAFEPSRMREFVSQQKDKEPRETPSQSQSRSEPTSPMPKRARQTAPLAPPVRTQALVEAAPAVRIIQEPPREAKVPAWVRNALMRGLELEAGARFSSMEQLLRSLSQEQRLVRRRKWVAGVATAAVGLSVVGGMVYQRTQVCVDAAQAMTTTWNTEARGQLEASFVATQSPFALEMARRVFPVFDQYAAAWSAQMIQACEATRRHGSQPEELYARRVGCLERRRQDLGATFGQMRQANAKLVERALDVAHGLPALSECADVESLSEQQRLPEDPTRRAEIARLDEALSEVKARLVTGRLKEAAEKLAPLEAPIVATGHLPLMAEMRYHLGSIQGQLGHMPEASRLLSQSVYDAEAGRMDRQMTYSLLRLLFVESQQKHFDQAESWAAFAEAALRRMGGDPEMMGDLLAVHSILESSQRKFPEALELMERARDLRQKTLASDDPKQSHTSFTLGRLLVDMGRTDEGLKLLENALVQTEAAVGPLHPELERRHATLSAALRGVGRYEEALQHARASLRIAQGLFGKNTPQVALRLDEVAMCQSGLGHHADALSVYQEALAMKRQTLEADDSDLSYSLDGVGQELLKLGRAAQAIAPLRQAVAFEDLEPADSAESYFALAQALHQTGKSAEARTQAALARQNFEAAGLAPRVTAVDAWLDTLPLTHQVIQARHSRASRGEASRAPRTGR